MEAVKEINRQIEAEAGAYTPPLFSST